MFDKLEDLLIRYEEVMGELQEPGVANDPERFRKLMKEQSDLAPIVEAYNEYKQCKQNIEDSLMMLEEESDEEMRELAKDPTFTIYYTSKKELMGEHRKILDAYGLNRVQLIPLGSRKYQKILATSRYLVNNVSFPTYFIRREGQVYLNTWHGTPLKTLGKKMAMGIQADIVFVKGRFGPFGQRDVVAIMSRVHPGSGQPLGDMHQQQRLIQAAVARHAKAGHRLRQAFGQMEKHLRLQGMRQMLALIIDTDLHAAGRLG